MLLEHKYFEVTSESHDNDTARFVVRLLPDCDVYRGHFPGHPVSPGVCNIEMVRECFARLCDGTPRIATIDRCRFTAVASPSACPELRIAMSWTRDALGYHLVAEVADGSMKYMDFKGTLK